MVSGTDVVVCIEHCQKHLHNVTIQLARSQHVGRQVLPWQDRHTRLVSCTEPNCLIAVIETGSFLELGCNATK